MAEYNYHDLQLKGVKRQRVKLHLKIKIEEILS